MTVIWVWLAAQPVLAALWMLALRGRRREGGN